MARARAWLAARSVSYRFHDFKQHGVPPEALQHWLQQVGWQALLNTRGTTWRRLDDAARGRVQCADSARALMLAQPSVIRRPVLCDGEAVVVGFDAARYAALCPGRCDMIA